MDSRRNGVGHAARLILGTVDLVGVDHAASAEARHDIVEIVLAEGEAAFRAAELAVLGDHLPFGIPGAVDDDRAAARVAVGTVQAIDAARTAVIADIFLSGDK